MIQVFKISAFQKFFVGLSGLFLCLFVLMHMVGNLAVLVGPEAYNLVSYQIVSNPLFLLAEIILFSFFVLHILTAIIVTISNKKALSSQPKRPASGVKKTSLVQRTLVPQGMILLVFLILHLIQFRWGSVYEVVYDGVQMRDFYRLAKETFANPLNVAFYALAVLCLGAHLKNGLAASLQSLGLAQSDKPWLQMLASFYAVVVTLGFLTSPIYLFLFVQ